MDSHNISESLDKVLTDYTTRHDKDSVIIMQFYKVEDRTILNIQHSPFYPFKELVDGGFMYKDKLAIYCLLDKCTLADSLIGVAFTSDKADDFIFEFKNKMISMGVKSYRKDVKN